MSVPDIISARLLRWTARLLAHSGLSWLTPSLFKAAEQIDPSPVPDFGYARMLWEADKIEDADQSLQKILAVHPNHPEANNLAGVLLFQDEQLAEAVPFFQRAISHNPRYAAPHNNLGNIYKAQGRLDEAERCYRAALDVDSNYVEALTNLGIVFNLRGDNAEAEKYCRRAIDLAPDFAGAHCNLGNVLLSQARGGEALAEYRKALELSPRLPEALVNLSLVLEEPAYLIDTIDYYEQMLVRQPNATLALLRIAQALQALNRWDDAFARLEQAIAINPAQPDVRYIRAVNFAAIGDARGVIAELDQILHRSAASESSRAFHLVYLPERNGEEICDTLRCWGESYAARPLSRHKIVPNFRRRLRVGYVSRDFGGHSVGFFLEPILRHHDVEKIEVYCYSTRLKEDPVTQRFKEMVPHWRDISTWPEQKIVDQIIADEIDVLVDLSGHTNGHRLTVFAHKPAPVQVTYLGCPATTGVSRIDYRLTDRVADPEQGSQAHFVEKLHYLPDCFLCYQPFGVAPDVAAAPSEAKGYITFCSFNNSIKINEQTVTVWSRILRELPDSRLLLKSSAFTSGRGQQRVLALFEAEQIDARRIELLDWKEESKDHLLVYNEADIALDTFPYNGTTTTCEALWMGVPVVALQGDRHSARVGASLLNTLGLSELLAQDAEGYVRIAVQLACNPEKLAAMRAGLRSRMQASPLLDQSGFTRQLEAAYFDMWRTYCASRKNEVAADSAENLV
jgi:protein O-GlcNAc transferase